MLSQRKRVYERIPTKGKPVYRLDKGTKQGVVVLIAVVIRTESIGRGLEHFRMGWRKKTKRTEAR